MWPFNKWFKKKSLDVSLSSLDDIFRNTMVRMTSEATAAIENRHLRPMGKIDLFDQLNCKPEQKQRKLEALRMIISVYGHHQTFRPKMLIYECPNNTPFYNGGTFPFDVFLAGTFNETDYVEIFVASQSFSFPKGFIPKIV